MRLAKIATKTSRIGQHGLPDPPSWPSMTSQSLQVGPRWLPGASKLEPQRWEQNINTIETPRKTFIFDIHNPAYHEPMQEQPLNNCSLILYTRNFRNNKLDILYFEKTRCPNNSTNQFCKLMLTTL